MAEGCVVLVQEAGKESKKLRWPAMLQAGDVPGLSKTVGLDQDGQSEASIALSVPARPLGREMTDLVPGTDHMAG